MVLLLAACTSHSETRHGTSLPHASSPELAAIDSLMWRQPDSALAMLQQFAASPKADSLDELNGHYCQLLTAKATARLCSRPSPISTALYSP